MTAAAKAAVVFYCKFFKEYIFIKMNLTFKHTKLACYIGYITQAVVINLAPLLFTIFMTEFSVSYEKLANIILINFLVQIFTDITVIRQSLPFSG